jgi:hypothetical protein
MHVETLAAEQHLERPSGRGFIINNENFGEHPFLVGNRSVRPYRNDRDGQ